MSTVVILIVSLLVLIVAIVLIRKYVSGGFEAIGNWFGAIFNMAKDSTGNIPQK